MAESRSNAERVAAPGCGVPVRRRRRARLQHWGWGWVGRLGIAASLLLITALPASAVPRGKRQPRVLTSPTIMAPPLAEHPSATDGVGRPPGCSVRREVLTYHGGNLIANADVFLLFWGNEWQTDAQHQAAAAKVIALYQEMGATGYSCAWNEYSLLGNTIGTSNYHGAFIITSEPASPLSDASIQQEILDQISAGHAPALTDNMVYVVLPPQGVAVDAGGETGCGGSNFVFCGYHDSFLRPSDSARVRYVVLPFPCEQGGSTCFFTASNDAGDSLQVVGSHELGESVTDPDAPPVGAGGWFSDRTGDENADICSPCNDTLAAGSDTLQVNSLWSNLAKGCVDSVPCAAPTPQCTDPAPGMCVAGRSPTAACALEWIAYPNMTIRRTGLPGATISCTDGQPFCDFDNARDGQCTFHLAACLNSTDPRLSCSATSIDTIQLLRPRVSSSNPTDRANAATILGVLSSMQGTPGTVSGATVTYEPPASTPNACTAYFDVVVPIHNGVRQSPGRTVLSPLVQTASSRPGDRLTLICKPAAP